MELRLDYAVKPSGLIASARTYSLILRDRYVYVLNVGPAGNAVRTTDPLSRWAVNKVYERIDKKVDEGMQRLDNESLDNLVMEKDSYKYTLADIEEVSLKSGGPGFVLRFKAMGKKRRFDLHRDQQTAAQNLADALQAKN
jgi:hypothetical protein